jgi:hypothetical protein
VVRRGGIRPDQRAKRRNGVTARLGLGVPAVPFAGRVQPRSERTSRGREGRDAELSSMVKPWLDDAGVAVPSLGRFGLDERVKERLGQPGTSEVGARHGIEQSARGGPDRFMAAGFASTGCEQGVAGDLPLKESREGGPGACRGGAPRSARNREKVSERRGECASTSAEIRGATSP